MKEDDLDQVRAHWSNRGSRRPDWAIEPGPAEESVWDYPRPPRLEDDSRLVRVVYGNTKELPNVAWSYEQPFADFTRILGYLGFYPSKLSCYVDGHRVAPQPGHFYGGWVTPEVVGPFKGEPGTLGW